MCCGKDLFCSCLIGILCAFCIWMCLFLCSHWKSPLWSVQMRQWSIMTVSVIINSLHCVRGDQGIRLTHGVYSPHHATHAIHAFNQCKRSMLFSECPKIQLHKTHYCVNTGSPPCLCVCLPQSQCTQTPLSNTSLPWPWKAFSSHLWVLHLGSWQLKSEDRERCVHASNFQKSILPPAWHI